MLYQYECKKCGEITEAWRSVKKRRRTPKCSVCGGRTVKLSAASNMPLINTGKGSRMGSMNITLDEEPIFVKNKYHFKELCKARDLRPVGLE